MNRPLNSPIIDAGFPVHGGELLNASRLSGIPVHDIIDFSISVNPLGYPSCVGPLVGQILTDLIKYPDSESTELQQNLADTIGINKNCINVTNGSTEMIYFLPALWRKNSSVVCVNPCFSEYERAFRLAGIPIHEWNLSHETLFSLNMDAFLHNLGLIGDLGGVIIGHPNNPTGNLCEKASLLRLLDYCEKRNIFLVADETFIEFSGWEHSLLHWVEQSKYLILVQSMTKFYALPGLRLGYGLTSPDIADKIRSFRPPWSVNAMAQQIGIAVLNDQEFKKKSREFIEYERAYLYKEMTGIPSIEIYPSNANFLMFRLCGNHTASKLYQNLLQKGLLVRNCRNFKGLDSSFFRVAVNKRAENDFLLSNLKYHLASEGA